MRWLLAALLVVPIATAQPLLVAVVPDLPGSLSGEEGIALGSATTYDLTGHSITDGEDTFTFPAGTVLEAGALAWFVANATTWASFDGPAPRNVSLPLQLGNSGDDLRLFAPDGSTLDAFAYGDGNSPAAERLDHTSPGLVLTRRPDGAGGWHDTDSPDDWRTPRVHRIGESSLDRPTFNVTRLTLYASPDSSFKVLTGLAAGARERLHLHVYELRSAALADALMQAREATPGLDLQVLVDQRPVGQDDGDRHATADALHRIEQAGGTAWLAGHGRYDYHHLKVLVADDAVAIQSENWVPSGVPQDPTWGNRGWGIVVHDAAAADWFAAWMAADRAAWDTAPFELATYDPEFEQPTRLPPTTGAHRPVPARDVTGSFRVTPVVAPDHTADPAADPIALAVRSASRRVLAQQLDLTLAASNALGWSADDALTSALAAATDAGADVRVLAAQPFAADDVGNADAVAWLAAAGAEARLFAAPGIATLHNKGVVADDRAIAGSLNGNHHSRSENREVSVIVEGPGVASYFAGLFERDWDPEGAGRDWDVPGDDLRALPAAPLPTLLAILGVACLLRRRS